MDTLWKTNTAVGTAVVMTLLLAMPCFGAEIVSVDRHLVRYDNGVVYDNKTGFEWYAGPNRGMSWRDARRWVDGLDAVGGGWRMPSRGELKSLHAINDGVNNITPLLYTSGYWIWAGGTQDAAWRWLFSFSYGGEGWIGLPPRDGGRAIAVRLRSHYQF